MCKLTVTNIDRALPHTTESLTGKKRAIPAGSSAVRRDFPYSFGTTTGCRVLLPKTCSIVCVGPQLSAKNTIVPESPSIESRLPQRWYFSLCSPSVLFFPVLPLRRRVPCLALRRGYSAFESRARHFRGLSTVFTIGLSVLKFSTE
jgi:hypothetical protein